jgi:hypothetical protein
MADRLSNRASAALVAALAITVLVAGCGGGGGDGATLTKAELIERGDEFCAKAEADLAKEFHNYGHRAGFAHKRTGPSREQEEGLITAVVLPRFQVLAGELGELSPPEDEAAEFEAIVEGLEEGVAAGEASPTTFRGGDNPFEEVNEKATEFGFEVCGES